MSCACWRSKPSGDGDVLVPEPSPGYWYGVQLGYEDAAQRLEDVLREDA
jgi:hypothetical protein